MISYNSPEQFGLWLKSIEHARSGDSGEPGDDILLDNSIDPSQHGRVTIVCASATVSLRFVTAISASPAGVVFCARHFDAVAAGEAMLWLERTTCCCNRPRAGPLPQRACAHTCRSLIDVARRHRARRRLDLVELASPSSSATITSIGPGTTSAAEVREREPFPDGTFRTHIDHSGVEAGVSYLVGEVHYSNWPVLMTRRGNAKLFLEDGSHMAHEAICMAALPRARAQRRAARRRPPRLAGRPLPALLLPGGRPARVLTQHHRDGDASLSSVSPAPSRQP